MDGLEFGKQGAACTLKNGQKTHRSRNKFTLRCAYSHTAVEMKMDCGAFFDVFLLKFVTCLHTNSHSNDGRPTGRPYKGLLGMRHVGTTRGASMMMVGFYSHRVS